MSHLIDRLEQYMEYKGINNNQVTIASGLSNGLIGAARKKRSALNSDSIEKILYAYRDLNPTWLITGEGEMLIRNSEPPIQEVHDPQAGYKNDCSACKDKQRAIDALENTVSVLKIQLEESKKDREVIRRLLGEKDRK